MRRVKMDLILAHNLIYHHCDVPLRDVSNLLSFHPRASALYPGPQVRVDNGLTMRLEKKNYRTVRQSCIFSNRVFDPWNSLDIAIRSTGDLYRFKKYLNNETRDQRFVNLLPFIKHILEYDLEQNFVQLLYYNPK